jgi:hypothetical protein
MSTTTPAAATPTATRATLHCSACGWTFQVGGDGAASAGRCPHCWQVELSPAAPIEAPPIEQVVPFSAPQAALDAAITSFAQGIPSRPMDLDPARLRERMRAIALPVYLVDADVKATWQAQAGFAYEVASHREHTTGAGWQTQRVHETRLRWEPRIGRIEHTYANVQAPALEEHDELLRCLGTYDVEHAIGVDEAAPAGAAVHLYRLPSRPTADAWREAMASLQAQATEECRRAAGAAQIREFAWQPTCDQPYWTLLHLPVWSTYYVDDDGRAQPVLINGQTGQLWGQRRASLKRARATARKRLVIGAGVFAFAVLVALIALLAPPLMPLAGVIAVVGMVIAASGAAEVAKAWSWNREPWNGLEGSAARSSSS